MMAFQRFAPFDFEGLFGLAAATLGCLHYPWCNDRVGLTESPLNKRAENFQR